MKPGDIHGLQMKIFLSFCAGIWSVSRKQKPAPIQKCLTLYVAGVTQSIAMA